MRNMSFFLSTEQFKKRTKDVTRRTGWGQAKPGDVVMGCRKCQGIKRGTLERLGPIIFKSVKSEKLSEIQDYPQSEIEREGFKGKDAFWFIAHMRDSIGVPPTAIVQRIEYGYLDDAPTIEDWSVGYGRVAGISQGNPRITDGEIVTSSIVAVGTEILSIVTSTGSVYKLGECMDELTYMERLLELKKRLDIRV